MGLIGRKMPVRSRRDRITVSQGKAWINRQYSEVTAFAAATPSVQVPRISESVLSPSEAAEDVPDPLKPGSYTIALRAVVHRRQWPVSPLSHDNAPDPAIILNPDLTVGMTICRRMLPRGGQGGWFRVLGQAGSPLDVGSESPSVSVRDSLSLNLITCLAAGIEQRESDPIDGRK